ncbi:MAG: hypothetical protein MJ131_06615 [Lachnospiraceae bacterium]|nr:hypothetical protein [Lachnospiraceae bacterium]
MHFRQYLSAKKLIIALFTIIICAAPAAKASAKDTVYNENSILYWRFDEGTEEQTVRIPTYSVPINFSYTYPTHPGEPVYYNGYGMPFNTAHCGSNSDYISTLLSAGVLRNLGDKADSVVLDTGKGNYNVWKTTNAGGDVYTIPSVATKKEILTYKVNYTGNAILIPCEELEFATNVQGEDVIVYSDDNVKLEYAVTKPDAKASSINYILGRNKTTVRLEAEYSYTRLVPLTQGSLSQKIMGSDSIYSSYYDTTGKTTHVLIDHSHTISNNWVINYARSNSNRISCGSGYWDAYSTDEYFTTNVKDFRSGNVYPVYSDCPVTSVNETVHFYKDIECYVIDTNEIKANGKDMDIYIKDIHKAAVTKENYRFTKNNAKFSVKYKFSEGFTVSGITRNTDVSWIHDTNIVSLPENFNGELIEWWPGSATTHYYTTPETINTDVPVDIFLDYGATLYFCDANKPTTTVKVKIPARSKAPKILFVTKEGVDYIKGLKAGETAIRLCGNDDNYIDLPDKLTKGSEAIFGDKYLLHVPDEYFSTGDPGFYLYTGGPGKKAPVTIADLVNITDSQNLNAFEGAYIEAVSIPKGNKPDSHIKTIYINEQPVFDTGASTSNNSIVLETGFITIMDADTNNAYEYTVLDSNGNPTQWKTIKSSVAKKEKALVDGATLYIRRAALITNDATFFLPSTYIKLRYDGQGADIPCYYYMADYCRNEKTTLSFYNDTDHIVTINGEDIYPGSEYTVDNVFANVAYSIKNGKLVKDYNIAARLVNPTESFDCFTSPLVNISELREGMTTAEVRYADYASYASETSAFDYTDSDGISIGHISNVTVTEPDSSITYIYEAADGKAYNIHPVHLLNMMMNS